MCTIWRQRHWKGPPRHECPATFPSRQISSVPPIRLLFTVWSVRVGEVWSWSRRNSNQGRKVGYSGWMPPDRPRSVGSRGEEALQGLIKTINPKVQIVKTQFVPQLSWHFREENGALTLLSLQQVMQDKFPSRFESENKEKSCVHFNYWMFAELPYLLKKRKGEILCCLPKGICGENNNNKKTLVA